MKCPDYDRIQLLIKHQVFTTQILGRLQRDRICPDYVRIPADKGNPKAQPEELEELDTFPEWCPLRINNYE